MFDVFEHTPEEKEQDIADMLRRKCTYKQIMKECHVSPTTISNVSKAMLGYTNDDKQKQPIQLSKETQAIKLFNEGKKPIDVAIELDIATDFVFSIYQKFQRLSNFEEFISSYEHVKGNMEPFLKLFDLMNSLGMTPEQVAEQVKHGYNLPYLSNSHSSLANEIRIMESQKQNMNLQLNYMQNQAAEYNSYIQFYDIECQRKNNELLFLDSEINTKKNLIQNLDNDEGYIRVKEDTKKETKVMIQNNYVLSAVTLTAALEAIRRYTDNQTLMFDLISSQDRSTRPNEQPWESHKPKLLQSMENVQNGIAEQIANAVISNVKSLPCNSQT